jgi:hypothetical protein
VIRVDDRFRETYAAATPAVQAHASTVKKDAHKASTRRLRARSAYVMRVRVDDRSRVTYAAATPNVRKVSGVHQNPAMTFENR